MDFTGQSLLHLQRLARIVKKELNIRVLLSHSSGRVDLLRRAWAEQENQTVIDARTQFLLTLTESEKQELASIITMHTIEADTQSQHKPATHYDRRQRNVHVDHDRRRKPTVYRGNTVIYDRRQQDRPFEGEERRGKGTQQVRSTDQPAETSRTNEKKGIIYRGQKIE